MTISWRNRCIPAMPQAEFLLIDNSNSFTKLALSSLDELGPVRRHPTRELDGPASIPDLERPEDPKVHDRPVLAPRATPEQTR